MSESDIRREVARRVFAREFGDSSHTFKESDDDRAPTYLLLPTGEKANRVFVVGTLTEKEDIGEDSEYWRARVVDPTGTFLVYAGQYQPEAVDALRDIEPPEYVAVVGKPNTYEPEDEDGETDVGESEDSPADENESSRDVITSIRPESINVVDAETRDRWIGETAERTLDRIEGEANEKEMAHEIYGDGISPRYKDVVVDALESLE